MFSLSEHPIYVAGNFIATNEPLPVINPFNNRVFGSAFLAGNKEMEVAVSGALQVSGQLAGMPSFQRSNILLYISSKLKENKAFIASVISRESAKPLKFALAEVERSIQVFNIAAEECKRIPAENMSLDWTEAGTGKQGMLRYFPAGIVLGITPFNFPLNLVAHKIAPAIAAGCPIILKPSTSTPLTALLLAQIINETSLPKGAVSVLPAKHEIIEPLFDDERIAVVSFTGSPAAGWKIKKSAYRKKVILELGGNAGVLITEGTNIVEAVAKCLNGAFAYSGQVCIHTQRIYVENEIFKEFSEKLVTSAAKLKTGDPSLPETDISTMIDEANTGRVLQWIDEAIKEGAIVLSGGITERGVVIPTILTNTKNGMKVCCEEVFGPVVIVESVVSFEDGIAAINASQFGLQAGVYTNKLDQIKFAFNQLKAGGVIINDVPTFRVDHMPYGGIKNSGAGREGVKYAMLGMMEAKLLVY